MNILIVTPYYQLEGRPDLLANTKAVHFLVRPWAKEHNVKVIYIYKNKFRHILKYAKKEARKKYKEGFCYQTEGIDVFLVEMQRIYRQKLFVDRIQGVRIQKMINSYLKDIEFIPDLVITHLPTELDGMLEGMFDGARRVGVLHMSDIRYCMRDNARFELLQKSHDAFFARSKSIKEFFKNRGLINLSEELISSGAPLVSMEERSGVKPHIFRIMYAGTFIPRKHVDLTIDALEMLKNDYKFTFEVYGKGKELKKLQPYAESKLGDICTFHGYAPRETILEEMGKSDIFIMPSTEETLGLVYIEAMACGCIPIGVKGEGIDGIIVNNQNGFLVEPNNVDSIVNTITMIFNMNEKRYAELCGQVYESGKKYNENDMGYKYLQLISGE